MVNVATSNASARSQFIPTGLLAYPAFDTRRQTFDTYIRNLTTGEVLRIITQTSQPELSPDGQQIAYRSWRLNQQGLVVESTLGNGITPWFPSDLFEAARPSWNNTATDIIFATNNISPNQWNLALAGDRPAFSNGLTPDWLPNNQIIYAGNLGNRYGLISADLITGRQTLLTESETDIAPAAAPDGLNVAFISQRGGQWDLYLLNMITLEVTQITNDAALDTAPTWSPDGSRIAFVSLRDGEWAIWTVSIAGDDPQKLLTLPGPFEGAPLNIPEAQRTSWRTEQISWVE